MSGPGIRRAVLLYGALVLAVRVLTLLGGADQIGEPDAAECKLTELSDRWILAGRPSWGAVVELTRSGRNAPHGGFLPVSLLHASFAVPRGSLGDYTALKAWAALLSASGAMLWVAAAWRLAGRVGAITLGALLLVPPPAFLGGTLVLWGSHAEAPMLLGLLAFLAAHRGAATPAGMEALGVGLAAGLAMAFDTLAIPVAGLLVLGWAVDRGGARGAAWAILAGALILGPWLWLTGALGASVTEDAGATPTALLAGATVARVGEALQTGRAFPVLGVAFADWAGRPVADAVLGAALLASGLLAAALAPPALRGRALLWLVLAPVLHLVASLLISPRPEDLPARYLLPLWCPLLLAPAWALALARRGSRGLPALTTGVLLLVGGLAVAPLLAPRRMAAFFAWDPVRTTAADLGHVDYALTGPVGVLLDRHGPRIVVPGPEAPRLPGLAAVLGTGSADAPLLTGAQRRAPEDVWLRVERTIPAGPGAARHAFLTQVGSGLGIVHRGRAAEQLAIVSRLPAQDRETVMAAITRTEADPTLRPLLPVTPVP